MKPTYRFNIGFDSHTVNKMNIVNFWYLGTAIVLWIINLKLHQYLIILKAKNTDIPKTISFLLSDNNYKRGFEFYLDFCKPVIIRIAKDRYNELFNYFINNKTLTLDKKEERIFVEILHSNNTKTELIYNNSFISEIDKKKLLDINKDIKFYKKNCNTNHKVYLYENKSLDEIISSLNNFKKIYGWCDGSTLDSKPRSFDDVSLFRVRLPTTVQSNIKVILINYIIILI